MLRVTLYKMTIHRLYLRILLSGLHQKLKYLTENLSVLIVQSHAYVVNHLVSSRVGHAYQPLTVLQKVAFYRAKQLGLVPLALFVDQSSERVCLLSIFSALQSLLHFSLFG